MNFKTRMSSRCFGLMLLAMAGIGNCFARDVKVNSRMNYYTDEQQAEILVYVPEGSGKAVFEGSQYPLTEGVNLIPVSMQSLKLGDNQRTIRVECQGVNNEYQVKLTRLSPRSNEVKIDNTTGGMVVDDLPFIPTGYYSGLKDDNYKFLKSEVPSGINLYSPYQNITADNVADRVEYLDLCARLGIKVNYNLCSLTINHRSRNLDGEHAEETRLQALREEIKRVKDHPALLSYYIADEPDGHGIKPEVLKRYYDTIHEIDPYHPISVVIISSLPARRYAEAYDIIMADPYPISIGHAKEAPKMMKEIYDQMCYEKSVWLVPQVFGGGGLWKRESNSREIRIMCYASILNGTRALQGFHRMPDFGSPLMWAGFKEVALELQQLTPYLCDANSKEVKTNNPQVQARAYKANGNMVIIAQNMEKSPCQVQVDIPVPTALKEAEQVFEDRKVMICNGRINDMLSAFGTGVYKIALEEPKSKVSMGNMVVNPSFEESTEAGQITGGPGGGNNSGNGATFLPDTRVAFDGETSLRFTNPYDGANATRNIFNIDNESDRTYVISVWAKADKRSLALNHKRNHPMTFKLVLGTLGEKTFELTDEWKRYEVVCEPKAYVRRSHGGARGSITLLSEGTAWFDLVQVTPEISIQAKRTTDRKGFIVSMENYLQNGVIHYTTNGKIPTLSSPTYKEPFEVRSVQHITARVFVGKKGYNPASKVVAAHKALDAKVTYLNKYHPKYEANGDKTMTDGVFAPMNAQAPYWHGYKKNNIDMVIDLGQVEKINRVEMGFLQSLAAWVMPPKTLEVLVSTDGETYKRAGIINYGEARKGVSEHQYIRIPFKFNNLKKKARYIRIKAEHPQTLPSWHKVLGESWMFIDEVIVE